MRLWVLRGHYVLLSTPGAPIFRHLMVQEGPPSTVYTLA